MIIVNFSTPQYSRGQRRLSDSIPANYLKLMFSQYETIGSPTHQESPYEFKIHAIAKAAEVDPIVLWADSSMVRVGDLSKMEKVIKELGYFMEQAGHWVGSWCNDHTRSYFKLTEEEGKVPGGFSMFSAGLTGLDFNNPIAVNFFQQWKASAKAGCFRGDWSNHRHDMTCGSIIAQRMGLYYQTGGKHMQYIGPSYAPPHPETVFHCVGL